ncbi:hypothetical protein GYMLUDRAFT_880519 [Collybiopsis luxurians FD-317 M1]|uniref:Uncharacterized protein n=1 Tax=Collybiopsis luxurians FD-317 M1 TaxID=944289 RepID=A0A0D0CAM6_9AGAR|nr:hypothetical protein GYMLUDRAFT_880519 [Collybiopsis luxurians FD-317 M1]
MSQRRDSPSKNVQDTFSLKPHPWYYQHPSNSRYYGSYRHSSQLLFQYPSNSSRSASGRKLHLLYVASLDTLVPFITLPCSPDNTLIPRSSSNVHCLLLLLQLLYRSYRSSS